MDTPLILSSKLLPDLDEPRAAYGLLSLRQVDAAIETRHRAARKYVEALKDVKVIRMFPYLLESSDEGSGLWHNYAYFPIFVEAEEYV